MLGVDIGGTGVRAARVADGAITSEVARVPLQVRSVGEVVSRVAELHRELGGTSVGVGMPGFVRQGVVLGSPNFPEFTGVDLAGALRDALGVPVAVGNDANAAALGLWRVRGGTEDLVLLTLGTGVGGGVILEGRPLVGRGGTAAELGHIYVGGARRCGCGGIGCLETWCGTVGLVAAAAERGHAVTCGEDLVEAAESGEVWADEVLDAAAEHLGKALVTLVNTFAPDVVAIGGGLTAARARLMPAVDWLRRYGVPPSVSRVEVIWEGAVDAFAIVGGAEFAALQARR